jgi:hypothetical protein
VGDESYDRSHDADETVGVVVIRRQRVIVWQSHKSCVLARSFWDQTRSDHHAVMTKRLDLAIKPVSRWPGFKSTRAADCIGQPIF